MMESGDMYLKDYDQWYYNYSVEGGRQQCHSGSSVGSQRSTEDNIWAAGLPAGSSRNAIAKEFLLIPSVGVWFQINTVEVVSYLAA